MAERRTWGVAWVAVGVVAAGAGAAQAQPAPPPLPPASSSAAPPPLPPAATAAPSSSATGARPPPPPPPPPPPYDYAPPAGPAPTYYQPPAGPAPTYYQPPAGPAGPAAGAPPPVLPVYDPDQPIPAGYRLQSKPTVGVLGMGIGTFSVGYVSAVVMGIALGEDAKKNPDGPDSSVFTPMYFPLVGPFVTMAVLKPGPAEIGLLLADSVFQIAGSVGILVGSLKRTYRLVYTGETASVELLPAAGAGYGGLQAVGQF